MKGEIIAVCISPNKGTKKMDIKEAILKGISGDAHSGVIKTDYFNKTKEKIGACPRIFRTTLHLKS